MISLRRVATGPGFQTKRYYSSKKFLVVVNPISGKRSGLRIYQTLKNNLYKNGYDHELMETKYPKHAEIIAREFRPENFSGIILVGGDGTIHEVLNGLALHEHSEIALRTPLGIIPAGSGNSLANSLNLSLENAMEKIFRQNTSHVDLFRVVINPTTMVFGFCVVSWGLHARIVCDSEKFRFFGNRRFVWSAIWNVLFRKHMAHIFLEGAKKAESPVKSEKLDQSGKSEKFDQSGKSVKLDQSEKSEKLDQSGKSEKLDQSGKSVKLDQSEKSELLDQSEKSEILDQSDKSEKLDQSEKSEKLKTFQKECPVGYLVITKVRELEKGFPVTPYACVDDGFVDFMLIPTCSRWKVGTFLFRVYSGAHLNLPFLDYFKARRVKLTPQTNSSPLCVDGEMYRVEVGKPVLIETDVKWRAVVYK